MDEGKLRTLAKSGGICQSCGGVCQPKIEHAILATNAGLPLCTCPDCKTCESVRNALAALEEGAEEAWKQTPQ